MKIKLFLIFALFLFANKSNSQRSLEIGDCLFEQIGPEFISLTFELLAVILTFDEVKIYSFAFAHPEILYATSYCINSPDRILKYEAEKIIKNFFGISYKVSVVIFDEEFTISEGFPKITFKFKNNCDIDLISTESSFFKIEGGTVISQKGMETTFSIDLIEQVLEQTGFDIEKMSIKLQRTLKDAISEGTVYFNVYLDKIEIGIIINQKINEKITCAGTMIITIEAGNLPPSPPPNPAPAPILDNEALNNAIIAATECGVVVWGSLLIIKLAKASFFGILNGPAGFLLGLIS